MSTSTSTPAPTASSSSSIPLRPAAPAPAPAPASTLTVDASSLPAAAPIAPPTAAAATAAANTAPTKPTPTPTPTVTLSQASPADLATLVALQFRCFSATAIEQIANPDTPANRASTLARHEAHMRDDAGMTIVKATVPVSSSSSSTVKTASGSASSLPSKDDDNNDEKGEEIIGFCMFYVPYTGADGELVLPTPLRPPPPPPSLAPPPPPAEAAEAVAANGPSSTTTATTATATATATTATTMSAPSAAQINAMTPRAPSPTSAQKLAVQTSIARTNLHTLLPYRHDLVRNLLSSSQSHSQIQTQDTGTGTGAGAGYVRFMCVAPAYRRFGVGRRMMEWGCRLFDEAGVGAYLEATADGEGLYRAFGFETVGEQVFEVDGRVRARYPCMWRERRRSVVSSVPEE